MLRVTVRKSIVLATVIAVGLVMAGSTMAQAVSTGGIGGRPANPDENNPRSQSIFINTVERGGSVQDTVLIANNSDETRIIELYAVDGMVTNTGAYTCRQKSEPRVDSGSWIKLSSDSVELKSGSEIEVPFTISAPSNADVGEHNACLVFADKEEVGEAKGNLRIHTRQAVRVVTSIPGEMYRSVTLDKFHAETNTRVPQFSLKLLNKGNVSADVDVRLTLESLFGQVSFKDGGVYPVLSNEKLELTFVDEKAPIWGGWYKAKVNVDYNTNAKTLGFNTDAAKEKPLTAEQVIFVIPSTAVIVGVTAVILLGLAFGAYRYIGRRNEQQREQTWRTYKIKRNDTIESLAISSNISWKQLAKTNNIQAPYILKAGQEIKLPQDMLK